MTTIPEMPPERAGWGAAGLDRWAILLVLGAQLSFFPWYPAMGSANELSRLYLVEALVNRHDVEIGDEIDQYGWVGDRSEVAQSQFSDKPPGTAFLVAPFVALRHAFEGPDLQADMRVARVVACVLPTLLLLLLLRLEMTELGIPAPTRALCLATYGLGTLGFTYSLLFYGHQLTAVLLYSTWFLLRRSAVGPPRATAVGALVACCVSVEYQSAVYLVPLAAVFLFRARPLPASIAAAVLGAAPVLTLTALYHDAAFGAPWRTGYSFVANPFFAAVHEQGFMGVATPRLRPLAASLIGASKGLFFFSPFLALGFAGLVPYAQRLRALALGPRTSDLGPQTPWLPFALRLALVVLPLLFVSSMVYWDGGWTVGQRHLTPLIPFLIAPAAALVESGALARALAPGLAAASVMMTGTATIVFPHLPESWANPFHDLTLPLLRHGCTAMAWTEPWIPSAWLGAAFAALFLLLLAGVITAWPSPLRFKAQVVAILVLLPIAWFDASSHPVRLTEAQRRTKRTAIVNACRSADRWDADAPARERVKHRSEGFPPLPPR